MTGGRALAILVAGCFALTCGKDSTGPSGNVTAIVNDPVGDQFGSDSIQPDLVKLTVTRDSGGLDILLEFTANVQSPLVDTVNGIIGYVDFDTDQDSTTGVLSATDFFRATGSTGMGDEFLLDFTIYNADSTIFVTDTAGNQTGSVRPVFTGKNISVRIPRSLLGNDDGFTNVATVVGSVNEPTDIAPNAGHLKVGGTPVAPIRPSASRQLRGRSWGGRWMAPR